MGLMPWDSVANLTGDVLDKIFPNKAEADQAKAALLKAQQAGALQQMQAQWDNAAQQLEVNKAEASSGKLFVAGWRPFVGWTCGSAFGWTFVLQPMLTWASAAIGHPVQPPELDLSQMMPVLLGMLGLGGMRSFEKHKGVSSIKD